MTRCAGCVIGASELSKSQTRTNTCCMVSLHSPTVAGCSLQPRSTTAKMTMQRSRKFSSTPCSTFHVSRRSAGDESRAWCQRRDSNSQTPVSKTGCYSNSHTLALWCTGKDSNLRVPLGKPGLQPVRFGRAHAPVQTWRKVDESNAHRSSRCPGFQDQLPAIQQYLLHWRRVWELNP